MLIKRLSKAISSCIVSTNVLEVKVAIFNAVLNIVIVNINVLRTFVIALGANKLDRRFIVAVELDLIDVAA
jgi:hypothetical protein